MRLEFYFFSIGVLNLGVVTPIKLLGPQFDCHILKSAHSSKLAVLLSNSLAIPTV